MKAKTTNRGEVGGLVRFYLEQPEFIELGTRIVCRNVKCAIIGNRYDAETKKTDWFDAMPLQSDQRIPKYSKFSKIRIV